MVRPDFFLQRPGKREGQTAMVRSGNTVSVHSWSASNQQWTKIGDVVGEPDKSGETPGPGLLAHCGISSPSTVVHKHYTYSFFFHEYEANILLLEIYQALLW